MWGVPFVLLKVIRVFPIISQTLHGTAIYAYIDPVSTTPMYVDIPVPLVVSGILCESPEPGNRENPGSFSRLQLIQSISGSNAPR